MPHAEPCLPVDSKPSNRAIALVKAIGSLPLAITILTMLVVVMVAATFLEKAYGAAATRFGIYGTDWFTALGAVMAANILCALVVRLPWRKQQTGFVLAHVGLLVILAGCYISRTRGLEATVAMFERQASSVAYKDSQQHFELDGQQHFELGIRRDGAPAGQVEVISVPFTPGPFNWEDYRRMSPIPWRLAHRDRGVLLDDDGIRLEVIDYYANARLLSVPQVQVEAVPQSPAHPPHDAETPEEGRGPFMLRIRSGEGPHGVGRPYGTGARQTLAGGQRLAFWMTGSEAETAAFRNSSPDAAPGKLGRLVLYANGETVQCDLSDWKPGVRRPLGKSGLEVELLEIDPRINTVNLKVHHGGESPEPLVVSAEFPDVLSRPDYRDGVFGSYWVEAKKPAAAEQGAAGRAMRDAGKPRIDLLLGADQKLYLRTWREGKVVQAGPLTADGTMKCVAFEGTPDAIALTLSDFIPAAKPDVLPLPLPFGHGLEETRQQRQVRLRVTVDGKAEEFWLAGLSRDPLARFSPPPPNPQKILDGKQRRVAVTLEPNVYQLGLEIRLLKAERRLDPGSKQPSYYASHVDLVPVREKMGTGTSAEPVPIFSAKPDSEELPPLNDRPLVVSLNAPVDFTDPASGRSYRLFQTGMPGPFPAEEVQSSGTEPVYATYLTLNYDPGRGLEYMGCLLVVVGVFVRYFMKLSKSLPLAASQCTAAPVAVLTLAMIACFAGTSRAADTDAESLDWSAWQSLPVLDNGRIMPLDTFARAQVKRLCGTANPQLGLAGAFTRMELQSLSPDQFDEVKSASKPRQFAAAELLFSWLAEPERWESIPLLYADDESLRSDLLEVPLFDDQGQRLRYVSPRQIVAAKKFRLRLEELGQQDDMHKQVKPGAAALDKKVRDLYEAYTLYRQLTFDASRSAESRTWAQDSVISMAQTWIRLEDELLRMPAAEGRQGFGDLVAKTSEAMRKLVAPMMDAREPTRDLAKDAETLVGVVERTTSELAGRAADIADSAARRDPKPSAGASQIEARWRSLASRLGELARLTTQAHWSFFDAGEAIRLVPAMEPTALEADRFRSEMQPWISFQALDQGSDELLQRYPKDKLTPVRQSLHEAMAAYRDRKDPQRAERFARATGDFAAAVRALAEAIEPQRQKLPIHERDETILAATAYPAAGSTGPELLYNRLDPFFWAWIVGIGAVAGLAAAMVTKRKPLFWLGIAVLLVAHAFIILGFGLRMSISHWVPITNMFETIIFVALSVAVLTLWLTFVPLFRAGAVTAWQLTAVPWRRSALPAANWTLFVARMALTVYAVFATGVLETSRSGGGYSMLTILPRIDVGSSLPTPSAVLIWAAGLCVIAGLVWYGPRLILAALVMIPAVVVSVIRHGTGQAVEQVYRRTLVALIGAAVVLLAALAAYYAPFPKDIKPLMAVLRSKVWLAIHVITIMVGYAAGFLAWGLANITLGYYLFGRYRDAADPAEPLDDESADDLPPATPPRRLPPAACANLAQWNYKMMQVAVLLLAIGTILGGMWADVSWGRFWGWDPKEVGALVSLLVYMIVLHGRHVGWSGSLALAFGSVLGFTAIILTWFVINFWMSGKHSYGSGEGEQWAIFGVLGLVVLNWLFLAAASARCWNETRPAGKE